MQALHLEKRRSKTVGSTVMLNTFTLLTISRAIHSSYCSDSVDYDIHDRWTWAYSEAPNATYQDKLGL